MDTHDSSRSRRARPHTGVTADGQRLREVLSYSRRGSRLNARQEAAWARWHGSRWIPDEAVDRDDFDLRSWFGREAPLVVEIGSGVGEATVALAAARPTYDVLALEVWQPGVADTLHRMEQAGVDNVRLLSVDAAWTLGHVIDPGTLAELWTFFPDPWPKKRHHRRRLSTPTSPTWPPPGCDRARCGGWPRTGRTTPSRWSRCSAPSRCSPPPTTAPDRAGTTGR